jgi:hypothetical protein
MHAPDDQTDGEDAEEADDECHEVHRQPNPVLLQ